MQSKFIKTIGCVFIAVGIILGIIWLVLSDWGTAISMILSGLISGFAILTMGTIVEHQEYTNEYLKILAVLKEKEMGEDE